VYVMFDNDYTPPNKDTDGNYGLATAPGSPVSLADSVYTAPSGGLYSINTQLTINVTTLEPTAVQRAICPGIPYGQVRVYIEHYDVANTLIDSIGDVKNWGMFNYANLGYVNSLTFNLQNTYNATAWDYFKILVQFYVVTAGGCGIGTINWRINSGSTFACTSALTGGGEYQSYNPEDYSVESNEFGYPISETDFETIDATPMGRINFNIYNQSPASGWIEQIKMYHGSGQPAKVQLNSSHNLNN
jgi:hypothetical protein